MASGGLGEVKFSILDEAFFQLANGANWVLADGRSIVGSQLNLLYPGVTVVPDLRGSFLRALDAGAGVAPDQSELLNFTPDFTTGQLALSGTPAGNFTLTTGQIVVVSVAGGSLPTGLSANTRYFVIEVSPSVLQVATTLQNAISGTFVAFTDNGSGTFSIIVSRVPGTFEGSQFTSHVHQATTFNGGGGVSNTIFGATGTVTGTFTSGAAGGDETRPQDIGFYAYVRIN
jgi:hypothetical protein